VKKTATKSAKRAPKKKAAKPVETVLVMRTCDAKMRAHGGFVWPMSGPVECPDWKPVAECGNGLHGLLWGEGDASLLNWSDDANWLVVEVAAADVVTINRKVKFPRGVVVYCGDSYGAGKFIGERAPKEIRSIVRGTSTSGDGGTSTSGDGGTSISGEIGILVCRWHDGARYRLTIGYVGEDGIKPNTKYRADATGKIVEVVS
jgi:hypothetical protein